MNTQTQFGLTNLFFQSYANLHNANSKANSKHSAKSVYAKVKDAISKAKTERSLNSLDAIQLKDIGINRYDIPNIVNNISANPK